MWVITQAVVYTGRKDKPFAQEGEKVNIRKDVARKLIEAGKAVALEDEDGLG